MTSTEQIIKNNYQAILDRIGSTCRRSGREPATVKMIAVVKYAQMEWVKALVHLGVTELGESRPQQLAKRVPQIDAAVHWHLIGHLQRNKARRTLTLATLIHSIDTLRLLQTIDRLAVELAMTPRVLLEVNVSNEAVKHGFDPAKLKADWDSILACRHVAIDGLMTMAPYCPDSESARPTFAGLRKLRDELAACSPDRLPLRELSMGMSGDFEVAIEEGATMVRIGRGLFAGLSH